MRDDWRQIAAAQARFIVRLAESNKREMFREDGATSPEAWVAECFGASVPTARSLSYVAEKAPELPHLVESLRAGDISFDKVRAVVDVATPETDRELSGQAKECSVRELVEVARDAAARARSVSASRSRSEHDSRYLRFNDGHRTMSLQLPTRSTPGPRLVLTLGPPPCPLMRRRPWTSAALTGSWGLWTRRLRRRRPSRRGRRGLVGSGHGAQPVLRGGPRPSRGPGGRVGSRRVSLAGELEHHGLIDVETVQRIACDATVVVAVDDEAGHTMYEGRARRFPSGAQRREIIRRDRHCRFPGCTNVTFTNVHHIVPWNTRRWYRPAQPGAVVPPPPRGGAPKRMVPGRRRQSGAQHQDPHRPRHGLAPFAALDQGDRRSAIRSVGVGKLPLRLLFVWLAGPRSVGSMAGLQIGSSFVLSRPPPVAAGAS